MPKHPITYALGAITYVALITTLLSHAEYLFGPDDDALEPLIPLAMLSLLVLSVATMAFLFFFRPFELFLSGDRAGAVTFFLKTLGTFALATFVWFVLLYLVGQQ